MQSYTDTRTHALPKTSRKKKMLVRIFPIGSPWSRWKSLKIIEKHWKPLKKHWKNIENHWEPLQNIENHWNSIEIHWKSLKNIENHWKQLKTIAKHWKSLKIIENHWNSLKIIETHWKLWILNWKLKMNLIIQWKNKKLIRIINSKLIVLIMNKYKLI